MILRLLLTTVLLLTCLSWPVQADWSPVKPPPLLVVTEELPPYNFTNNQGEIVGENTRIVRQILKRAGLDYRIVSYPWIRAYRTARNNSQVLIYTIIKNEVRAPWFHWFCPIAPPEPFYLIRLKENTHLTVTHLDDTRRYRIGLVKNSHFHNFLNSNGFTTDGRLDITAEDPANIRKLFKGRIDFIGHNGKSLAYYLAQHGKSLDDVTTEFMVYMEEPRCMALNINTPPPLVKRIRQAFAEQMANPG